MKLIKKSSLLMKPKSQICIATNGINEKQNQKYKIYQLKVCKHVKTNFF